MVLTGTCSACGAHSSSLRRCQGLCGGSHAAYCSKACQARHWKSGHKRTCGKVPQGFAMTVQQAASGRSILRCTDDGKNMHPFCLVGGNFLKELVKYLRDEAPEMVEIEYYANIKEASCAGNNDDDDDDDDDDNNNGKNFERNCNLPKAAVERAKKDSEFDHALSHSVALAYDDELLAAARANDVKCDCGSDEPVTRIFHCPITKARPDRYAVVDMFARPCCSNDECLRKIKGDFMNFQRDLVRVVRENPPPSS